MKVTCTLLYVDQYKICVEFIRKCGEVFEFYELYREIEQQLTLHNDAVLD